MDSRIKDCVKCFYLYGCSGSILMNYRDVIGISEEEALEIAKPYLGGKMIKCGALLATEEILKRVNPQKIDEFEKQFLEKNHSLNCRELKGLTGGKLLRTCAGCIEDSCTLLEEYLESR
mgnify:CR=1 FL=1